MDVYRCPTDIIVEIATYLPFGAIANWALANKRHYELINPILYQQLTPLKNQSIFLDTRSFTKRVRRLSRGEIWMWAAERGLPETMQHILVAQGGDASWIDLPILDIGYITEPSGAGKTAMQRAARGGHANVIDWLVQQGADVDAAAAGRTRAMHCAGNEEAVRSLARHGSSPHPLPTDQSPPLTSVIWARRDLSAVRALLDLGADPNVAVASPEHLPGVAAVEDPKCDYLQLLLERGLDVVPEAVLGRRSLIQRAIRQRKPEVVFDRVKMLLDHGAAAHGGQVEHDENGEEIFVETNLYTAVKYPDTRKLIELLVEHGAELDTQCYPTSLETPFRVELEGPETAAVRLLYTSILGRSSDRENKLSALNYLVRRGAKLDPSSMTFILNHILSAPTGCLSRKAQIYFLLDHGADVNSGA